MRRRPKTASTVEILPTLYIDGLDYDPRDVTPLSLVMTEGSEPEMLRFRVNDDHENYTKIVQGTEIWLRNALDESLLFHGWVLGTNPTFNEGEDGFELVALGPRWYMDRNAVYWHIRERIRPNSAIEIIWEGARDAYGRVFMEPKIGTDVVMYDIPDLVEARIFRQYFFSGEPAGQAIDRIIHNEGPWVTGIEFTDGDSADRFYAVEKTLGKKKKIVAGSAESPSGDMRLISLEGTRNSSGIVNRYVGMGDSVIMETSLKDTFEDTPGDISAEADWDSDLNSDVLSAPGRAVLDLKYENVGRRYKVALDNVGGISAENIIGDLVQNPYKGTETDDEHMVGNVYKVMVWVKETDREYGVYGPEPQWYPCPISAQFVRVPPAPSSSSTILSERTRIPPSAAEPNRNTAAEVYVIFDNPLCYASKRFSYIGDTGVDYSQTYDKFCDVRLTFTTRKTAVGENLRERWGKLWTRSSRRGDFPIEVTRYFIDETYKRVERKSMRRIFDSDGSFNLSSSQNVITSTVQDDTEFLKEHVNELVKTTSYPIDAFRLVLSGLEFHWQVGDVVDEIANLVDMKSLGWTVVRVSWDLMLGLTTLITDNEAPYRIFR